MLRNLAKVLKCFCKLFKRLFYFFTRAIERHNSHKNTTANHTILTTVLLFNIVSLQFKTIPIVLPGA